MLSDTDDEKLFYDKNFMGWLDRVAAHCQEVNIELNKSAVALAIETWKLVKEM
jgi:hypothetical protein